MVTSDMGCGGALGDADGVCARVGAAVTSNSEASKTVIKGRACNVRVEGRAVRRSVQRLAASDAAAALTAMPALRAL
ncbi:hypothetical protein MUG10_07205 [Xanthomonas prunicola]|uniref:hypothetical protein n=1 Tax=Xanthomonas prunicola TaxID=2053930 RepID=UPI0020791372|nr:hypothetical protein [Xanthomonas prunicola]USJ01932.1 hypothetical protein MUG10_07205 [Xanthomonas prunicola]